MPETTTCPNCARQLRVPDNLIGRPVKCPSCGTNFQAERQEAGAAASPAYEQPPAYEDRPSSRRPPPPPDDDYDDDEGRRRSRRRRGRRGGEPHRGGLILALGIIGLGLLLVFPPLMLACSIPAWVMGNHDMRQIQRGVMDNEGEGLTQAGRICGIIGTLIGGLSMLACCGFGMIVFMGALAKH